MFGSKQAEGWREHVTNIVGTYGLTWFWVVLVLTLLKAFLTGSVTATVTQAPILSVLPGLLSEYFPAMGSKLQSGSAFYWFLAVFCAPVFEEILFRLLPLTLVQRSRPEVIFAVQLAVCGVIFGWIHGSPLNIFIQGFGGFMLGRLYMKNASSMLVSWGSCALVHAMYNMTVLLVWSS